MKTKYFSAKSLKHTIEQGSGKNMKVQVANPIYDTVFKYIMSDSRIAKTMLSAIIGETIVELSFSATERVIKKGASKKNRNKTLEHLTVCRFDFRAKIETDDGGYKIVSIELQKARLDSDIMRFRRYLGEMYQDGENSYSKDRFKPQQIYCIYILNYCIGYPNIPILKVDNIVTDVVTGLDLHSNSAFVNGLHHLSWIVQVDFLKENRRNKLERLLSIFDQSYVSKNKHILEIDESEYPEEYHLIIRKLLEAFASKDVRENMKIEDEFFDELIRREALIAQQSEAIAQQSEALAQQSEALAQQSEAIAQKDEALAQKDAALQAALVRVAELEKNRK